MYVNKHVELTQRGIALQNIYVLFYFIIIQTFVCILSMYLYIFWGKLYIKEDPQAEGLHNP